MFSALAWFSAQLLLKPRNRKDEAVAHYALEGLPNKVMAAEYQTVLPEEKLLAEELERTRKRIENRLEESG